MNFSEDDLQYALEATRVIYEPDRRIDTFHNTRFEFQLISPLMDQVDRVRIRTGEVEAQKPQIIKPQMSDLSVEVEGFGTHAEHFFNWLKKQEGNWAFFRYGFQFKRGEVKEELVSERIEQVRERLKKQAQQEGRPMLAVIEGVDDAWEISLLRFTMEMIQKSGSINAFDFKRKGLI